MDTTTSIEPSGQATPPAPADPALNIAVWLPYMRRHILSWLRTQARPADADAQAAADSASYWLHGLSAQARLNFVHQTVMAPLAHRAFPAPSGQALPPGYFSSDETAQRFAIHLIERFGQTIAEAYIVGAITLGATQAVANRVQAPAMATALRPSIRAAGQVDTAPSGMSKTTVGILTFVAGAAVGAGAVWLLKKPRANSFDPTRRQLEY